MQNHLNLIYREEEREMLPLCIDQGIGLIPWSPLARGRLARPWGEVTNRTENDEFGKTLYDAGGDANAAINAAVEAIAKARGVKMAQVALAWVLQKQPVTAPIVGVTKLTHISDARRRPRDRTDPRGDQIAGSPIQGHRLHGVLVRSPKPRARGNRVGPIGHIHCLDLRCRGAKGSHLVHMKKAWRTVDRAKKRPAAFHNRPSSLQPKSTRPCRPKSELSWPYFSTPMVLSSCSWVSRKSI